MHSIYLYTDVYQGLNIFANSYIYIYILTAILDKEQGTLMVSGLQTPTLSDGFDLIRETCDGGSRYDEYKWKNKTKQNKTRTHS